jgi:Winged helix DNA-binding domain
MASTERIDDDERRARVARRHRLAPDARGESPVDATRAVVVLHSSDPVTVFLSTWARTRDFRHEDLERALYEDRSLVRMLGMRRTLFVVPHELVSVVDAACTKVVAARERRRLEAFVAGSGIVAEPGEWIDRLAAAALSAVVARGEASTSELTRDDPLLATKVRLGIGTRWESEVSAGSRILLLLAAEGRIVRGRPRGTWISSQYRWEPIDVLGPLQPIEPREARVELLRLWLAAFGPGTEADIRWWTAWTARETREALAAVPHANVELEGGAGFVLADDLEATAPVEPWPALLPALDPTVMGWKERDWYLGPYARLLFDTSGNAGPTVWWEGRVVGGWAQRKSGEVVYRLLEDVGREAEAAIAGEAERLTAWFDGAFVTPRFPTPVHRELAG